MKLAEVLEFCKEDLLDDRSAMLEGASDELHGDKGLVRLIAHGQRILAAEGCFLFDEETDEDEDAAPVTLIPLVADQTIYALHPKIHRVVWARLSDTDIALPRADRLDVLRAPTRDMGYWDVNTTGTLNPGRPRAWTTNYGAKKLIITPAPSATEVADDLAIRLGVIRFPLQNLSHENLDVELEIPEEYHLDLAFYAAGTKTVARTSGGVGDNDLRRAGRDWLATWASRVADARKWARRMYGAQFGFIFGSSTNGH